MSSGSDSHSTGPLRAEESVPAFVATDAEASPRPQDRFGALAAWTDSRVKRQTHLAAFGLLAVAAIAVLLVFFH